MKWLTIQGAEQPMCAGRRELRVLSSWTIFPVFSFLIFYVFIHEGHTERGRDIRRGRSRFSAGSVMRDLMPGPQDHDLSPRQTTTETPRYPQPVLFSASHCPLDFRHTCSQELRALWQEYFLPSTSLQQVGFNFLLPAKSDTICPLFSPFKILLTSPIF